MNEETERQRKRLVYFGFMEAMQGDGDEAEEGGRSVGGAKRVGGTRRPWHGMAWCGYI